MDFELAAGCRLTSNDGARLSWTEQAALLYRIIRAIARTHTVVLRGVTSTLAAALAPRTRVPSLTPLGAPMTSGFGRRPQWLAKGTTEVVAANVIRALVATGTQQELEGRTTRTFAKNWYLDFSGYPHEGQWKPEPVTDLVTKLQRQIDALASAAPLSEETQKATDSHQMEGALWPTTAHGKAAAAPTEARPTVPATSATPQREGEEASIDPHIPLPTITREMKAAAVADSVAQLHPGRDGREGKGSSAPLLVGDAATKSGHSEASSRGLNDRNAASTRAGSTRTVSQPSLEELETVRELMLLAAEVKARRQNDAILVDGGFPTAAPARRGRPPAQRAPPRPAENNHQHQLRLRPKKSQLQDEQRHHQDLGASDSGGLLVANGSAPRANDALPSSLPSSPRAASTSRSIRASPAAARTSQPYTSHQVDGGKSTISPPKQLELASPTAGCILGHQSTPLPFRVTQRTWRGAPPRSLLCAKCYFLVLSGL